ncbi:MAG: LPS export ABC transporter periplasmic protein LptC [Porphyromonadaceae bacterium]|nr:MAG: LPS export ABC transporter periplasmic protein LptC [Porphyromonadaceae bacterium]
MRLSARSGVRVIPLIMGMTLICSCGNDIEKINKLDNPDTIPAAHATDVEIIVSDSAFVRIKIVSPELKDFQVADSLDPKTEFPQGLVATFYNKSLQVESTLVAGYAIYHTKRKLFEASKDVVIKNFTQDQELHTDQLWWDEINEKIWSEQAVTIITPSGTTYGDSGFESDQNFTKYSIRRSHGQMKVKENFGTDGQQQATIK